MYDVIVIGKDVSSLISALISARLGLKTALITEGGYCHLNIIKGYSFSLDPLPVTGIGEKQILSTLFREIGLDNDCKSQLILMDPALQIITASHRIDIHQDKSKLIGELTNEFPYIKNDIENYFKYVFKVSNYLENIMREDSSLSNNETNLLKKISCKVERTLLETFYKFLVTYNGQGSQNEFKDIARAMIGTFSNLASDRSAHYIVADSYFLSLPMRGIYYPVGGRNNWLSSIHKEFINSGGHSIDSSSIIRIHIKSGIIVDLEQNNEILTIRGEKLIISSQLENLQLLLSSQNILKKSINRLQAIKNKFYKFSLHIGIKEDCVPEKMAPYVLLIPDDHKSILGKSNFIFIELSLPSDLARAPANKRALTAMILLGTSPLTMSNSELRIISQNIFNSIEKLLPFLNENIDFINIDYSIEISRKHQEVVANKYYFQKKVMMGTNILPQYTTLPNVFFTGSVYNAGIGFEGEVLSAIRAAKWALQ